MNEFCEMENNKCKALLLLIMSVALDNYPEIILSLRRLHLGLTFSVNLFQRSQTREKYGVGERDNIANDFPLRNTSKLGAPQT